MYLTHFIEDLLVCHVELVSSDKFTKNKLNYPIYILKYFFAVKLIMVPIP